MALSQEQRRRAGLGLRDLPHRGPSGACPEGSTGWGRLSPHERCHGQAGDHRSGVCCRRGLVPRRPRRLSLNNKLHAPAQESTTKVTVLAGAASPVPVPTTLTRGCSARTVVVTAQPGTTVLSSLCLVVGTELVVKLAKQVRAGTGWSGPPFLSGRGVLVENSSGAVDGRDTGRFQAAAPGRAEVMAASEAACAFAAPTPCSLPAFVTTLDVRVVGMKSRTGA